MCFTKRTEIIDKAVYWMCSITLYGGQITQILISKSYSSILQSSSNRMILVVVLELRGDCCKVHLKVPEEDEEMEEVTGRRAAADEISTDAAVVAVLSEPDGISTVKKGEEQHQRLLLLEKMLSV